MRILCRAPFDLKLKRFKCVYAFNENEFYEKVLNKKFDVLIVSFEYFAEFLEIKEYINSNVIFLTDYCDVQIYKKALEVGDFCYQYSEYDKLILRLEYLQKKCLNSKTSIYKFGELLYNYTTGELYKNSLSVSLSTAEKELLRVLIKHKDKYLSKEDILSECDHIESEDSVKVLISHLRKKGINIQNCKNLGYKIRI